jgi:hypothetical protein
MPLDDADDDRATFRALAGCVALFVARLPSPYREAITLVELEGLTAREAAALADVSVSGMKSRVQRGRAQLRAQLDACCRIDLDVRGKVTDCEPRPRRLVRRTAIARAYQRGYQYRATWIVIVASRHASPRPGTAAVAPAAAPTINRRSTR